jgi:hypothetical protein
MRLRLALSSIFVYTIIVRDSPMLKNKRIFSHVDMVNFNLQRFKKWLAMYVHYFTK